MKISIITVCLNCAAQLEQTINSVLNQNYNNIEYIIVDGVSTDGTLEIAKKYESKHKNIKVYSSKDKGIYDAMNKGISYASGDYVFFLNAGDTFYSKTVIKDIVKNTSPDDEVIYGNVNYGDKITEYPTRLNLFYLVYLERMVCHQGLFVKRNILKDNLFDLDYRICADRDLLIRLKKSHKKFKFIPNVIISNYDTNGVSSNKQKYMKESDKIAKKYGGVLALLFIKIKRIIGKVKKLWEQSKIKINY